MKLLNEMLEEGDIVASNYNVINVEQEVKQDVGASIDKKRGVCSAAFETNLKQKSAEPIKPSPRGLLQAI
jgi:hypothetical protein